MTACNQREDEWTAPSKDGLTLRVPITVMTDQPLTDETRVGDPGMDSRLDPPKNLYVFAWVKNPADNSKYLTCVRERTNMTDYDWERNEENPQKSRYRLREDIGVEFKDMGEPAGFAGKVNSGDPIGRVCAVACNEELTKEQIETIEATLGDDDKMKKVELSLSAWSSNDLRDLYSNPLNDTEEDDRGAENGEILFKTDGTNAEIVMGNVRLYHAAAKIDFTWEVEEAARPTVAVKKIEVNNLPTTCKIFNPTANPATATQSCIIGEGTNTENPINPGNKWAGRAYFYALQPGAGTINYTVDFDGGKNTVSPSFTPSTLDKVFTGWYRIIAKVKN